MALYRVLFDFEGQEATELSVKKGEELIAQGEPQDDWLLVARGENPALSGYVPMGYVERVPNTAKVKKAAPAASMADSLFNFPQASGATPTAATPFGAPSPRAASFPTEAAFSFDPPSFAPTTTTLGGPQSSPAPFGFAEPGFFPIPTQPIAGAAGSFGSPPFTADGMAFAAGPLDVPQPKCLPEIWAFPGGLPREPLPPLAPAVVYPALPPVQPIQALQVYEDAYMQQVQSKPKFEEVDDMLEESCASLQELRKQHLLASGQLQQVRDRLEVEGGRILRHRAAVEGLPAAPPLRLHDSPDDPLPQVEYAYRKFLPANRPYQLESEAPASPAAAAGPSAPSGPIPTVPLGGPAAPPDLSRQGPSGAAAMDLSAPASPASPSSPADDDGQDALERHAVGLLNKAEVAVQQVRDDLEALALTPMSVASQPEKVVHARKVYDELLLQQMMKVDCVDSHGIAAVRQRRKELLRDIEKLHHALDELNKQERHRS